jgi:hypothetical protein
MCYLPCNNFVHAIGNKVIEVIYPQQDCKAEHRYICSHILTVSRITTGISYSAGFIFKVIHSARRQQSDKLAINHNCKQNTANYTVYNNQL